MTDADSGLVSGVDAGQLLDDVDYDALFDGTPVEGDGGDRSVAERIGRVLGERIGRAIGEIVGSVVGGVVLSAAIDAVGDDEDTAESGGGETDE